MYKGKYSTVQTASQVYTKYTVLFSLASAQNLHEGLGLLLDLSCLLLTNRNKENNMNTKRNSPQVTQIPYLAKPSICNISPL